MANVTPAQDPTLLNNARGTLDKRYQSLIEHSTDLIALFGGDLTILYDSPSIQKVLGYTPEEHVGRNALEFMHPDEKQYAIKTLGGLINTPMGSMNLEMRVRHKDGHYVWAEVVATNMIEEPNVKAIVVNYRDITARKLTEEQLLNKSKALEAANVVVEEARAKNEAVLESMGEGVITTDGSNKIISWNQQMETMLGYTTAEVMGKDVMEVIHAEDENGNQLPIESRALNKAFTEVKKVSAKYFYRDKSGRSFPVFVTATPYFLKDKVAGAVSIVRDITQEIAMDNAKNEFVALVSHELRTPLTAIRWHTQKLIKDKESLQLDPSSLKSLNYIFQAGATMGEITESILTVSKLDLGKLFVVSQSVNILGTINRIVDEFKLQFETKNLKFKMDLPQDPVTVNIDEIQTKIILQALISNAVKYTPEEGEIFLGLKQFGDHIIVSIKDTGLGIPEEEKGRIFSKLYRATNARATDPNGMGLGLYISRIVVQKMGGDLWFESQDGKGSTFYLKLLLVK